MDRTSHTKTFLLITSALILIVSAQANAQATDKVESDSSFHRWGLQFGIDEDMTWTSWHGKEFSLQYMLTACSGIRAGFNGDLRGSFDPDVGHGFEVIRLQFVRSWKVDPELQIVGGIGPEFGLDLSWDSFYTTKEWMVGGSILFGAEYFISNSFSLRCEYDVNVDYTWHSIPISAWGRTSEHHSQIDAYSSPILFGASIYF